MTIYFDKNNLFITEKDILLIVLNLKYYKSFELVSWTPQITKQIKNFLLISFFDYQLVW